GGVVVGRRLVPVGDLVDDEQGDRDEYQEHAQIERGTTGRRGHELPFHCLPTPARSLILRTSGSSFFRAKRWYVMTIKIVVTNCVSPRTVPVLISPTSLRLMNVCA